MSSVQSGSAKVISPNPFFEITINVDSKGWTGGSGGTWYFPDINGYLRSVQKKAQKSNKVADESYKIIAIDFIPGSDFHDESYYRQQLSQQLLQCGLAGSTTIDEVVTFSMRFENGEFESLNLLWKREPTSTPVFMQLLS